MSPFRPGPLHYRWGNFTSNSKSAGRKRAMRRFKLRQCEYCDEPAVERHHFDGNPVNNHPNNVVPVCRQCHMIVDGRLAALVERNEAGRKWKDVAEKARALRARRTAEGRPIKKKKKPKIRD